MKDRRHEVYAWAKALGRQFKTVDVKAAFGMHTDDAANVVRVLAEQGSLRKEKRWSVEEGLYCVFETTGIPPPPERKRHVARVHAPIPGARIECIPAVRL